jgi:hypothetical protein
MRLGARWWIVACSFAVTATLLVLDRSPNGDLAEWYTDHLHHAHATWVAMHKGLAIYTEPFRESLQGVAFRHPAATWDHMPGMVYPPGVLAVFAPMAVLGQAVPMARATFGLVMVLYMLAIAHLALAAVLKALDATARAAGGFAVAAVLWLVLLRMGMNGFFDGAWIACGAMLVHRLASGRPVSALRWFALAALLHFRAAVLVPLAAAALWEVVRGRRPPWGDLALVGLAIAVCLGSFALMLPVTSGYRSETLSLLELRSGTRFWMVVGLGVAGAILALRWADLATAATVVAATLLALAYVPFWWHGSVAVFVPLAVAAHREGRAPARAREAMLVWLLVMQPLGWAEPVETFVLELAAKLNL